MPLSKANAARSAGNRRKNATPSPRPRGRTSAETVFARIVDAIRAHRLTPGTRLVEERLGAHFGVSRTIVRQGLAKLAQAGLVELSPNRGARIAWPDAARTVEVFDARALIEVELVARAARTADRAAIARLRAHLRREDAARARADRLELVRLTGEFHAIVADIAGNSILARTLVEYETVTCLAILAHARSGDSACPPDEHAEIVAAIEARDARRAAALMRAHLAHVLEGLDLTRAPDALETALSPSEIPPNRRRPTRRSRI
jgi:DNA-binding GntR family transcriptional regulator